MHVGVAFDEQAKRRVVLALGSGVPLAVAAERSGFSVSTVRRHMRLDPEFAQNVADAVDVVDGNMEKNLHDWIVDQESIGGALKWLERRQARTWGEQKLVVNQHVGPGGGPIQVAIASTDTLRELLSDDNYRDRMLELVRDVPMIEATGSE